ncbi:MAG: HDOD domain-containing protein [Burkholderiales bacterium]
MPPAAACDPGVDILLQQAAADVPVLRATADEIARLRAEQERVSGNALAAAILRDPLMTLRVLRFLYSHRTRSQTVDITTIAHAIMMLGQARFFREFEQLPTLEERLDGAVLEQVRALMSRSRLAALFARDWALQRHDIDPEEIMVAALLHDSAHLLLVLCAMPVDVESSLADQLRAQLLARLEVPGLVAELNDETAAPNPRVVNVRLACVLARHCYAGWPSAPIQDDLAQLQRFLRTSQPQAWERVRKIALAAAREWDYYRTLPALALLPFVADESSSVAADPGCGI